MFLTPNPIGAVWLNYFLLNRLMRMTYFPEYLGDISKWLEDRGTMKNVGMHRTWKLFATMSLAGHWCACAFFYIALGQAVKGEDVTWPQADGLYTRTDDKWDNESDPGYSEDLRNEYKIVYHATKPECYARSLYWAYITMVRLSFSFWGVSVKHKYKH
jgi:hypothetical protein